MNSDLSCQIARHVAVVCNRWSDKTLPTVVGLW